MLAKFKFETVVEDVNEMHIGEWTNIIYNMADPPVPSTPLTPYALPYQLERHGCALDGEKLKRVSYHALSLGISIINSLTRNSSRRSSGINTPIPALTSTL
jgi:hypothetical protein